MGCAFIAPNRRWQNGFVKSLHGKFRDECLNRKKSCEARGPRVIVKRWRNLQNYKRPHRTRLPSAGARSTGIAQKAQYRPESHGLTDYMIEPQVTDSPWTIG